MIVIADTIYLGIISLRLVLLNIGMVAGIVFDSCARHSCNTYGLHDLPIQYGVSSRPQCGRCRRFMLGPIGGEGFGAAQVIFLAFTMGSHTWPLPL